MILETLQTDAEFTLARYKPQLCTLASFKLTCLVSKHVTLCYVEGPVWLQHNNPNDKTQCLITSLL